MSLPQRKVLWRSSLLAVLVVATVGIGWIYAQREQDRVPVESLIPAESVIYATFDGTLLHKGAYRQTAAYQALHESGLADAFMQLGETAAAQSSEARDAMEALQHLQDHGLSFCVAVDPPQQGPPRAWGVIVVDEAGEGVELLTEIAQRIPDLANGLGETELRGRMIHTVQVPRVPVQVGWWAEQGHLMIAFGMNAFENALDVADGERENVTNNPLFNKYGQSSFDFAVSSSGWFNFKALRDMFGQMPVPVPVEGRDEPVTVNTLLALGGFDTFNSIGVVTGYKGKSHWSEVLVDSEEERRGVMSLLDQETITLDDLPAIPTGQKGIFVSSGNWSQVYELVQETVANVAELAPPQLRIQEQFNEGITKFESVVGLSPEEILEPLGHIHCLYTDTNQSMFGLGSVLLVSVKDADQAQENLEKLLTLARREAKDEIEFETMEKHDSRFTTVNIPKFPLFNPTVAITDDWLIFGAISQAVDAQLLRMNGTLPSFDLKAEHAEAWEELPSEFTALSIVDPRDTYSMFLGFAPTMVGFVEMGLRENGNVPPDFKLPFNAADIPPVELVTAPLFANISMTTVDEDGTHSYARSSLPGIPLLGGADGGTTVATSAVLVALLLPAVQQARVAARTAQSKNNLKQQALSLHNYHDTYGHFPAGTVSNPALEPDERLSWLVSVLPFLDQQALWTTINMKEAWNSEANEDSLTVEVPAFLDPNSKETRYEGYAVTNYVGVAGLGEDAPELPVNHERAGIFGYDRQTRIRDITDGTSNTLMVIEASDNGPWSAGGYSTIRAFTDVPYLNGPDSIGNPYNPRGTTAALADGSVRTLSENIDPSVIEALSTISGGEIVNDF